jgi:hypothetical protein
MRNTGAVKTCKGETKGNSPYQGWSGDQKGHHWKQGDGDANKKEWGGGGGYKIWKEETQKNLG